MTAHHEQPEPPASQGRVGWTRQSARVYGVDYQVFEADDGGALYVTRYGLPLLSHLWPDHWFNNRRYASHGQRLTAGTGHVYRVPIIEDRARPVHMVVKFSRFAQDVPVDVQSTFDGAISKESARDARFHDPFEEFGVLWDLRRGRFGPRDLTIRTKHPLAIYRVPRPEPAWRLGRQASHLQYFKSHLADDQRAAEHPVTLDEGRVYVVLYHWIHGLSLQQACDQGLVGAEDVGLFTRQVARDLEAKGFVVYDHKPHHVIVRRAGDALLHRAGRPVYAMIDFELLERTPAYKAHLISRK